MLAVWWLDNFGFGFMGGVTGVFEWVLCLGVWFGGLVVWLWLVGVLGVGWVGLLDVGFGWVL